VKFKVTVAKAVENPYFRDAKLPPGITPVLYNIEPSSHGVFGYGGLNGATAIYIT